MTTPALPMLTVPASFAVPVIARAPLPALVTDAPAKSVPMVAPLPLAVVDVPLTVTLPLATPRLDDVPSITPAALVDVPVSDVSPDTETLVELPPSNSNPRDVLLLPSKAKPLAPELVRL